MRRLAPIFRWLSNWNAGQRRERLGRLPRADRFKRVLIAAPGHYGDLVLALPMFKAAVDLFKGASIEALIHPDMVPLAERLLPELHYRGWVPSWFPKRSPWPGRFRPPVRGPYDLVIELRGEIQAGLALRSVKAGLRIGLDEFGTGLFHHVTVPVREGTSQLDNLLAPLRLFAPGLQAGALNLDELYKPGPIIALAPFAGSQSKEWPWERWLEMVKVLGEAGHRLRVIGAESEKRRGELPGCEDWRGRHPAHEAYRDFEGCCALVANDSFLGHLGALVGLPTVSVFSAANDLERWRPRGPAKASVLHRAIDCAGCRRTFCHHRSCLVDIQVEEALVALQGLLV